MIIDSHQHFWKYDSDRGAWIDETMEVIRKDFLPKDLKPILEQNGIDGCIAVQADYNKVFALINDYLEQHSTKTKVQVLGINANNIYNL